VLILVPALARCLQSPGDPLVMGVIPPRFDIRLHLRENPVLSKPSSSEMEAVFYRHSGSEGR